MRRRPKAIPPAAVERAIAAEPLLAHEKESAQRLGGLLRQHLPAELEPPSSEFFTSRLMEEIKGAPVVETLAPTGKRGAAARVAWFRQAWFPPLASAASVALLFLAMNGSRSGESGPRTARAYAPDPKVIASAFYSEEAGATVIDLKGLDAVPDDREIRAYDVAEAGPITPGKPLVLHAANDPERAILVLAPGTSGTPHVHELN